MTQLVVPFNLLFLSLAGAFYEHAFLLGFFPQLILNILPICLVIYLHVDITFLLYYT